MLFCSTHNIIIEGNIHPFVNTNIQMKIIGLYSNYQQAKYVECYILLKPLLSQSIGGGGILI